MIDIDRTQGQLSAYLHAAESAAYMIQSMSNNALAAKGAAKGSDVAVAREIAARLAEASATLRAIGEPTALEAENAA